MLAALGSETGVGTTGAPFDDDAENRLTRPTRSPASCRASVALPSGCPVRSGITYDAGWGPALTSRLIFGAATPLALAGGLCDTT